MLLEICHSPQQGLSSPTVLCYLCVTWGPILSGSHGKNKNSGGHCLLSTYSVPHMILAWHTICSSQKWRVGSLIALKSSTSTTAGCHWALSSSVIRSDHKHPPLPFSLLKFCSVGRDPEVEKPSLQLPASALQYHSGWSTAESRAWQLSLECVCDVCVCQRWGSLASPGCKLLLLALTQGSSGGHSISSRPQGSSLI